MDEPRLEATDRGSTVFFKRYLYSQRDPTRRPRIIAQSVPPESRCLYLAISPLLGYGLDELLERVPADSHVIALETSQELFSLCRDHVDTALFEQRRLTWVRLSDETSLFSVLEGLGLWRFRRVRRVNLNSGSEIDSTTYERLVKFAVGSLAGYWRNRHALGTLGRHWVRHFYANIAALSRSDTPLVSPSTNKRARVIIGAGPSLDKAFDFIISHRDKLDVWATDTALAAIRRRGIEPDIVCVLETQAWNHLDFHDTRNSGLKVLADMSSYPPTLNHTGGTVEIFTSLFARLKFLERVQDAGLAVRPIPPLGSVGLAAVHLALTDSSLPIFLLGLDFAYKPGKTHARGTSVHRWQLSGNSRTNPVPGWQATMRRPRIKAPGSFGENVPTDTVLAGYAALLRDRYGDSSRIYVLHGGGLELGLPVLDGDEAVSEALGRPEKTSEAGSSVETRVGDPGLALAAGKFLKAELRSLQTVIDAWDAYSRGSGDSGRVKAALEELDQVYCDFPDEPPLPRDDLAFLVRAVQRCRSLHRYILRISSMPESA